ncbi:hypothetical protein LIER_34041 [Lithospermum erythrorhizon]|uniref:Uncharacterized protein n=1 Tax=Lithospermum erythrorhizon TaxID=34254 RepID=A0AAV3RYI7_LITER
MDGFNPPDGFTSGSEQGGGKTSQVAAARGSYASAMKRVQSSYKRMDLTFVSPNLVEGKPLVELPTSVVMSGRRSGSILL